jgi:hypothetical protein
MTATTRALCVAVRPRPIGSRTPFRKRDRLMTGTTANIEDARLRSWQVVPELAVKYVRTGLAV